jgi:hypothetical protein
VRWLVDWLDVCLFVCLFVVTQDDICEQSEFRVSQFG